MCVRLSRRTWQVPDSTGTPLPFWIHIYFKLCWYERRKHTNKIKHGEGLALAPWREGSCLCVCVFVCVSDYCLQSLTQGPLLTPLSVSRVGAEACNGVSVSVHVYLCISSPTSCLSGMCVSYYLSVRHYCGVWKCPPDSLSGTVISRCVCVCECLLLSPVLSQLCQPYQADRIIQLPRTSSSRSGDSVRLQLRMNYGLVLFKNYLCQRRIATLRDVDFTFKRENFVLNQ